MIARLIVTLGLFFAGGIAIGVGVAAATDQPAKVELTSHCYGNVWAPPHTHLICYHDGTAKVVNP
jgi:hypothetical protein